MKKIQKTIKINYILNVALKDYAEKHKQYEIDVIEKALDDFFKEKENNEVSYNTLNLVQHSLNELIEIKKDINSIRKTLDETEIV